MNRIEALERSWMKKSPPACRVGDLIRVHVRVIEGEKQRVQPFEGVVIGRKGGRHREMITVRKVSYGVGVERIFPIHSPFVERIEVVRSGKVRRAKLFYLRKLSGRAAKLAERESLPSQRSAPAVADGEPSVEPVAESANVGAGSGRGGGRASS
jgi:large subunit ribosomal protein L19